MVKIKNKHRLKQKDLRGLQNEITNSLDDSIVFSNEKIDIGRLFDYDLILIDDIPCFIRKDDQLFFTIKGLLNLNPTQRFVTVDMGAVKFVTNGADVMAPGIVNADFNIAIGDAVWICDENHKKPLAVGIALLEGSDMVEQKKGKAVQMIHYIGDELWNFIKVL